MKAMYLWGCQTPIADVLHCKNSQAVVNIAVFDLMEILAKRHSGADDSAEVEDLQAHGISAIVQRTTRKCTIPSRTLRCTALW